MTAWNENTRKPRKTVTPEPTAARDMQTIANITLIICIVIGLLSLAANMTGRKPVDLKQYEDGSVAAYILDTMIFSACIPAQPCDY